MVMVVGLVVMCYLKEYDLVVYVVVMGECLVEYLCIF